jgi:hypothetical protein
MLKVLRKHNKWILVVGGSLLMIAWLMPASLQRLGPASRGAVEGTLDGRKVRQLEVQQADAELRVIEFLVPFWPPNVFGERRTEAAHWLLLSHEAEEAGFVGGPQDGVDWLQGMAMSIAMQETRQRFGQLDDETFQRIVQQIPSIQQQIQERAATLSTELPGTLLERAAGAAGLNLQQAQQALAKARGMERMATAYISATRASDRAALVSAQSWGDQAMTDTVFIPADLVQDGIAEPTEEDLQAHFQKFRDAIPGAGEFGIGYMLPPRIKLEWLKIDRAAVAAAVPVDPVAAYKRWQQNHPAVFKGEFAEEKAAVETAIRNDKADEIIQNAILVVKAEVLKAIKSLESDGQYKKLPSDWGRLRPRLADVALAVQTQVSESSGTQFPLPAVTIRDSEWLTADDLAAEPDLANTQLRYLSNTVPLVHGRGQLPAILQIRELGFENPLRLQTGVPFIDFPAEDPDRNIYFFTILDARKQSPPDSVDEVRDAAIADLKKIRAYEILAARADEFRQMAIAGGPEAVVGSFRPPELTLDVGQEAPKLPSLIPSLVVSRLRVGPTGPQVNTEAFRNAVMGAGDAIDPLIDPAAYDPAAATVAVPIPEQLGLAVARIKTVLPLTWETYRQNIEPVLQRQSQQEVVQAAPIWPFSFKATAARHGWTIRASDEDEEVSEDEAPPTENG